jgi:hypothetical protein
MAAIPTVTLNDDHTLPVLGVSVADVPPADVEATVIAALQAGYRLIDTAPSAGNEEAVGAAIATSGIARDELYVTAKLATADQGFQSSQDACRASLARLGLDYVDLYLIDWPAEQNGKYIDAWGGIMKSKEVGDTATIVKLFRVALLLPVIVIVALMFRAKSETKTSWRTAPLIPGFLLGFIALVAINSTGLVPKELPAAAGEVSRWLLVAAIAAVGVKTSLGDMFKVGLNSLAIIVLETLVILTFALTAIQLM